MIYIFIAGSYFPWLQLQNPRHLSLLVCMEWMIWVMAAIGIMYQQVKNIAQRFLLANFDKKYKRLKADFNYSYFMNVLNVWRHAFM